MTCAAASAPACSAPTGRAERPIALHRPMPDHAERSSDDIWSAVAGSVYRRRIRGSDPGFSNRALEVKSLVTFLHFSGSEAVELGSEHAPDVPVTGL
jgi:hypothetical protein